MSKKYKFICSLTSYPEKYYGTVMAFEDTHTVQYYIYSNEY